MRPQQVRASRRWPLGIVSRFACAPCGAPRFADAFTARERGDIHTYGTAQIVEAVLTFQVKNGDDSAFQSFGVDLEEFVGTPYRVASFKELQRTGTVPALSVDNNEIQGVSP